MIFTGRNNKLFGVKQGNFRNSVHQNRGAAFNDTFKKKTIILRKTINPQAMYMYHIIPINIELHVLF